MEARFQFLSLFIFLLSSSSFLLIAESATPAEISYLTSLFDATGGLNWNNNGNWLTGDPCGNSWQGISCNISGSVTQINLSNNNLIGIVPAAIFTWSLSTLDLSSNYLTGTLPTTLPSASSLNLLNNYFCNHPNWCGVSICNAKTKPFYELQAAFSSVTIKVTGFPYYPSLSDLQIQVDGCDSNYGSFISISNSPVNAAQTFPTTVTLSNYVGSGGGTNAGYPLQTVTVDATYVIIPTITCNQNVQYYLSSAGTTAVNTLNLATGSEYQSLSTVTVSANRTSFNCGDLGTTSVLMTASDSNGETNTCIATAFVNPPPISASCSSPSINLISNGTTEEFNGDYFISSISGNVCNLYYTFNPSYLYWDCSSVPSNPQSALIKLYWNSILQTSCTTHVTVVNLNPSLSCQSQSVTLTSSSPQPLTISNFVTSYNDDCSAATSYSSTLTSVDCGNVNTPNDMQISITDTSGTTISCITSVDVSYTTPTLTCESSYSYAIGSSGSVSVTPSDFVNQFQDICQAGPPSFAANLSVLTCAQIHSPNYINIHTIDSVGTPLSCNSQVQLTYSPTLTCKQGFAVFFHAGGFASLTPSSLVNSYSDNCGHSPSFSANVTTFGCNEYGTTQYVQISTVNSAGDTISCVGTVNPTFNPGPTLLCNSPFSVTLGNGGTASIPPSYLVKNYNDPCVGSNTFSASQTSFSCSDVPNSPFPVSVSITDDAGITSQCTAGVSVHPDDVPTLSCQNVAYDFDANGNLYFSPDDFIDTFSDTCAGNTVFYSNLTDPFGCSNAGSNGILVYGYDAADRYVSCTATLYADIVVTCTSHVIIQLNPSPPTFSTTVNASSVVSVQGCPLSMTISPSSFSISDISTTINAITFHATPTPSVPYASACTTTGLVVIGGMLDVGTAVKEVRTSVLIKWLTTYNTMFASNAKVTLFYVDDGGNQVSITTTAINYSVGRFDWIQGFEKNLIVNNYYNIYMTINGKIYGASAVYVIA